jgi:hypothetical protein
MASEHFGIVQELYYGLARSERERKKQEEEDQTCRPCNQKAHVNITNQLLHPAELGHCLGRDNMEIR